MVYVYYPKTRFGSLEGRRLELGRDPQTLLGWVVVTIDDGEYPHRVSDIFEPCEYEFAKDEYDTLYRAFRPKNEMKVMAVVDPTPELIAEAVQLNKERLKEIESERERYG